MKISIRLIICVLLFNLVLSSVYGQDEFPDRLPHQAIMVQWSSQGDLYATGHVNGSVRIYDENGLFREISSAHTAPVFGLAFSPDGSRLATGGYDGNVHIWNVSTETLVELINLGDDIATVNWRSDGGTIFATSTHGIAYVISADTLSDSYIFSEQLSVGLSFDTDWSHDDSFIGIGLPATDIRLVNTSNYTIFRDLDATPAVDMLQPPNEFTTSLAWHPTENIIANGKVNGLIYIWDLDSSSDTAPILILEANNGVTDDAIIPFEYRVVDIGFNGDGRKINSISSDGTVRMWDTVTGQLLLDINLGETVLSGAFSPDSSRLVYNTYSLVDVSPIMMRFPTANAGADQTRTINSSGFTTISLDGSDNIYGQDYPERLPHQVATIRWNLQGTMYASTHMNGEIRIYEDGIHITTISAHSKPIYGLNFSPDSSHIATGSEDGNLRIWDVVTGDLIAEFLDVGAIIDALAWNSDGNLIWTAPFSSVNKIIKIEDYTIQPTLDLGQGTDILWHPNENIIAIGRSSRDIILVNLSNDVVRILDATPDTDFFEPPNEFTTRLAWHPTENIIANGKVNGLIYIWDLDSSSDTAPILILEANNGVTDDALIPFEYRVVDIGFDGDGRKINSISSDGTVRMWDTVTGQLLLDINLGETILSGAFSPDSSRLVYNTYSLVDVPPIMIRFPNADAGADQTLTIHSSGFATITLDGSASFDPDGEIIDYVWTLNGVEIATGAIADVQLGIGVHEITLTVTDNEGLVGHHHD